MAPIISAIAASVAAVVAIASAGVAIYQARTARGQKDIAEASAVAAARSASASEESVRIASESRAADEYERARAHYLLQCEKIESVRLCAVDVIAKAKSIVAATEEDERGDLRLQLSLFNAMGDWQKAYIETFPLLNEEVFWTGFRHFHEKARTFVDESEHFFSQEGTPADSRTRGVITDAGRALDDSYEEFTDATASWITSEGRPAQST